MTDGAWIIAELDGALVGLAAETVLGVIAPPPVTPIPFAPGFIDGLIGTSGEVVPLIDLGRRLGGPPAGARNEVLRMRVGAASFALGVDRVVALAQLGLDDDIEPAGEDPAAIGIWRWRDRPVRLLDATRVGVDDVAPAALPESEAGLVGQAATIAEPEAAAATEAVMVVELDTERLALPLGAVNEVIDIANWTAVPQAPAAVIGLAFPRNAPLLLLSLARLVERPDPATASHLFVVVERDGARFGLAVARVVGIRRYQAKAENPLIAMPRSVEGHYVEADGTPVGAIAIERLIDDALLAAFRMLARAAEGQAKTHARVDLRQFLIFAVGDQTCALPIEAVERVIEYTEPLPLPAGGPAAIRGAIEVQGRIVPVTLASERIATDRGVTAGPATETPAAYVVLKLDDGPIALAVDRLQRILPVPVDRIEAFGGGAGAIAGVGRIDDRVLWILAAERMAGATKGAAP
jgi:purine-binding chemotaxis protein CheW